MQHAEFCCYCGVALTVDAYVIVGYHDNGVDAFFCGNHYVMMCDYYESQ